MANDIAAVFLDTSNIVDYHPSVKHERDIAISDLLHDNTFAPHSGLARPLNLHLAIIENRIVFKMQSVEHGAEEIFHLSARPFRTTIKSYFEICQSYNQALSNRQPHQIEAIDMGRRGLHNEGAELLQRILLRHITTDHATTRKLFTMICILHIRSSGLP